jgi:hypothetical protein
MEDMGNKASAIEWRLELVQVPASDVDRAKAFYVDRVGFLADPDGNGWAVQEITAP